ncbi:SDR family NAD(P)-dependent oxidoreductase [Actinomadura sp. WMMB 499]|uniref:SDR family NAD(P)-dependent oxidoreductase n=1 Tax=Actinomadura sp. WMMB 499 TaxID=1219491 RepID=UPI001247C7F0|nr:SDR family oxidoreductase [Actinomadura sp. WMMB 499]QFG20090.1 SDR family oxidoreductase [Actinomadura sp. WMMB 499]
MTDMFDLTGRRALVTGAARGGLGAYAALALARRGAEVIVADLPSRGADLDATLGMLRAGNARARALRFDVTREDQVETLVAHAADPDGRLDVLVNAAGVMLRKDVQETSAEEWRRVLDVNLTGTWLLNRAAGRRMTERGRGAIVNFSTVYAERVGPVPESAYYASKAGVANLTRSMAAEFGPRGVTVNCLAPAVFYPTEMTAPLGDDPERLRWMRERTMLGRLGEPGPDLDGPLLLLASDAGRYMTGQIVYVDGGWSAW